MPLIKQNFKRYTLDEDRDREMISVSINPEERKILNEFKDKIGQKNDSTALKLGFLTGANVIHVNFSGSIRVHLFKKNYKKRDKTNPKVDEM